MICLAWPLVGATYITAEPAGHLSASMIRVVAASLLLPQRRPAATTLNRVLSVKTVCCHGRREKFRSAIYLGAKSVMSSLSSSLSSLLLSSSGGAKVLVLVLISFSMI